MSDFSASDRFLRFNTPLGENRLMILTFDAVEEISHIPVYRLECGSTYTDLKFDDIIGKNVTLGLELPDGSLRYWNGYVNRFVLVSTAEKFARYRLEFVPWFWFLTRTSDCRIFQHQTAGEIIENVFNDLGFKDFKNLCRRTFRNREYCTQYRETACNFVMRLMEEEGIFFFFEHFDGKHVLVMADSMQDIAPCPHQSQVHMDFGVERGFLAEDSFNRWTSEQSMRTGNYQLNDFNFEIPNRGLQASASGLVNQGGNQKWEFFDYPGGYDQLSDGTSYVDIRMDEEEASHAVARGTGGVRTLAPGFSFTLSSHSRSDQNGTYAVTRVTHHAEQGGTWAELQLQAQYHNSFECIPVATQYRAPRTTPKPVVSGSQTAIITGISGEEIYVDKYGRVKVQFHWDRRGKYDENSSCWVRVAQIWAGKRWGAIFHPRIGQEVIVDFLEGDPDRPIITGRVYNADEMPPYTLPDESTKSTIKTRSSKGGGGFNELRFEDKKGAEQFFLHAEKDMHERVKNDSFEFIGHERHLIVGLDQLEEVKGDKHLTVTGDQNEKFGGTVSRSCATVQDKAQQNYALNAGVEIHLKAGTNFVLEAGAALTLKVGGNFININSGGIFIKGTMVMINSGGAAGSGAGSNPEAPKAPKEADKAEPGDAAEPPEPKRPPKPAHFSPQATVLLAASHSGAAFCDI